MHYQRWVRHGDPLITKTVTPKPRPNHAGRDAHLRLRAPEHPLADSQGDVLVHRMIAWDAGLFDDPSLIVHHIDEDPTNNDLSNLQVMTRSEHGKIHGGQNRHTGPCAVSDCGRPARSRGWCPKHYARWRKYGSVELPQPDRESTVCTIDGCERTDKIRRGWCVLHYTRWVRHGDPLITKIRGK